MMKSEFENLAGREVTDEQYRAIERLSQIVHIPSRQDKTGHLHKSLTEAVDVIVI